MVYNFFFRLGSCDKRFFKDVKYDVLGLYNFVMVLSFFLILLIEMYIKDVELLERR